MGDGKVVGRSVIDRLKSRLRRYELLLELTRLAAKRDKISDALKDLTAIISRALNVERSSLLLNDPQTGELYSLYAEGTYDFEIRILNTSGVAGHVFTSGKGLVIHNAYKDKRFNVRVDERTGYVTRNILCVPIRTLQGEVIGVAQALNRKEGRFTREDRLLLEEMLTQVAHILKYAHMVSYMRKTREQEMKFLDVVTDLSSELNLGVLLRKVISEVTNMLDAERSTLFLNDEKSGELWSEVGEGLKLSEIRFPNHLGIAGSVFQSGESVNIPHAYADLRFNPAFDKQTGFFTRSILCVPVVNKNGKRIGVTQVLNKRGGSFTDEDESRLRAFTAQISIGLENAKLFHYVQNMKNYNESMLESMSNGVITLDEQEYIVTCNSAGYSILNISRKDVLGKKLDQFFEGGNEWVVKKMKKVNEENKPDMVMDTELVFGDKHISVNLSVLPLIDHKRARIGSMLVIEDISVEKRMKATMSRHMDPVIADELLEGGGKDMLGGKSTVATVLFSDIRGFTTLTERLGAQGTVALLNEYFSLMVDCIQREEGMLDKFIGDAIMAAFGIPVEHGDDADRAVRTAISMMNTILDWNAKRLSCGTTPINIGIGLNTDSIVSGNIGSPKRMDYTLIGDGVNLAARLESACKQYSAKILISENTYSGLRGTYRTRNIDKVIVKGKTMPVEIYEVLDYHTDDTFPNLMDTVVHFHSGIGYYREMAWDKAVDSFTRALTLNPNDAISKIYLERCKYLKANAPDKDWNGIWVMTSK